MALILIAVSLASACCHPHCKPLIHPGVHPSWQLRGQGGAETVFKEIPKPPENMAKEQRGKASPSWVTVLRGPVSPRAAAERRHWKLRKGSGVQPCSCFRTGRHSALCGLVCGMEMMAQDVVRTRPRVPHLGLVGNPQSFQRAGQHRAWHPEQAFVACGPFPGSPPRVPQPGRLLDSEKKDRLAAPQDALPFCQS